MAESQPCRSEKGCPVVFLAVYLLCLSAINLARLELGFLLYFRGVSWFLAHEVMSGVFYFALFL